MPHGKHAPGTALVTITMPDSLRDAIDEIARAEEIVPGRKPNRTAWVVKTLYHAVEKYRAEKSAERRKNPELARSIPFQSVPASAAPIANPSRSSTDYSRIPREPALRAAETPPRRPRKKAQP